MEKGFLSTEQIHKNTEVDERRFTVVREMEFILVLLFVY